MAKTALEAIYRLGVSPTDASLCNCLVVGDRVVVVDHELDEELREEDLEEWSVEEIVEGNGRWHHGPTSSGCARARG